MVCHLLNLFGHRRVALRHGLELLRVLLLLVEHVLREVGVGDLHQFVYLDDLLEPVLVIGYGGSSVLACVGLLVWIVTYHYRGLRIVVLHDDCIADFRVLFQTVSLIKVAYDSASAADDCRQLPCRRSGVEVAQLCGRFALVHHLRQCDALVGDCAV